MPELHKEHSRLYHASFTEEEREDFHKRVKKDQQLIEYLFKLLESFQADEIDTNDKNWLIKRAYADGANHVIRTIKKVFKEGA